MKRLVEHLIKATVILVLLACAAYAYARYIEPALITVSREEIECAGLMSPVKIVAISDIHVGIGGMNRARVQKIMAAAEAEEPDIVVFLGDLFENYRKYSHGQEQEIASWLALPGLADTAKFAVMGNHDLGGNAENAFREVFQLAGWTVLVNESAEYMGLNVIGSDNVTFGSPNVRGLILQEKPNLLLIHEPDYGDWLSGVQVQLSGHTHGGQVCLPFAGALTLPAWGEKYVHGLYKKDSGGYIYVNRGLGMSGLPLRFFAPPEISVITLKPGS